jgi:hypothetical protein
VTSSFKVGGGLWESNTFVTRRERYCTAPLVEKPGDMMYDEKSYWNDEKIQRTSHDAHFSVV